jgi:hypothetical protein
LPSSLLVANPINRYLINSPMVPKMKPDADGGMTLYVQHESPGKESEANWLPAPKGPFWMSMRLYWPKDEALQGKWGAPKLETVKRATSRHARRAARFPSSDAAIHLHVAGAYQAERK